MHGVIHATPVHFCHGAADSHTHGAFEPIDAEVLSTWTCIKWVGANGCEALVDLDVHQMGCEGVAMSEWQGGSLCVECVICSATLSSGGRGEVLRSELGDAFQCSDA